MEYDTVGPSDAMQTCQKLGAVSVFSEPTLRVALYSDVFGTIPDELPSAPHKLMHVTLIARTQETNPKDVAR